MVTLLYMHMLACLNVKLIILYALQDISNAGYYMYTVNNLLLFDLAIISLI